MLDYVPSIKKDGPIRPHEAKKLVAEKYDGALRLAVARKRPDEEALQGDAADKLALIKVSVGENVAKKKAARQASRRARPIVQGEVVLQVGDEGAYVEAPPNEAPQRRRAAEAPPPGCCLVM